MKEFYSKIKNKKLANQNQKKKELWDVEGILHNQYFKFDLKIKSVPGFGFNQYVFQVKGLFSI